jgi:hypothetical protein
VSGGRARDAFFGAFAIGNPAFLLLTLQALSDFLPSRMR